MGGERVAEEREAREGNKVLTFLVVFLRSGEYILIIDSDTRVPEVSVSFFFPSRTQ